MRLKLFKRWITQAIFYPRSQQVAAESEEIGEAIITDLGLQREGLERARGRLQDTNAELSRGRRILLRLKVATLYNKIILLVND